MKHYRLLKHLDTNHLNTSSQLTNIGKIPQLGGALLPTKFISSEAPRASKMLAHTSKLSIVTITNLFQPFIVDSNAKITIQNHFSREVTDRLAAWDSQQWIL